MEMSLQTAFKNESIIRRILSEQTEAGVQFNTRRANRYLAYIECKKLLVHKQIRPMLHLEVVQPYTVPVNKPFLKDGSYSATTQRWYGDEVDIVWGAFTRVVFEEPDLGSRKKLQSQLIRMGWKPRAFTEKGNPKLTVDSQPCPSLNEIDSHVGAAISLWYTLSHRESQIKGWIQALRPSQRLSQGVITIGTPTYRFRHKTVVNVPKAVSWVVFGKQMRSLFTVPKGKMLVGHDASGLELRMLAHYLGDPAYTKIVTEGDPHEYHRELLGLETRDAAKEFIYKFNYGAGGLLIGMSVYSEEEVQQFTNKQIQAAVRQLERRANKSGMVGIGKGTFVPVTRLMAMYLLAGNNLKETFLRNNKGLEALIERVQEASKRGYLIGLDGRRIQMRRDFSGKVQIHKALNTLMQSAGSVVMKHSIVLLDQAIRSNGLSSIKVYDMHDEAGFECLPHEADAHGQLAVQSIRDAGILLELNCKLDAEYKVGTNWSQTH